jgi:hypothetical protein
MNTGIDLIAAERHRQIEQEGWTAEHDDAHDNGELATTAACYAAPDLIYIREDHANRIGFLDPWPFDCCDDKRPKDGNVLLPNATLSREARIRQLVKAGALIAAEIDRLQRALASPPERT